jgi:hypothetical protein
MSAQQEVVTGDGKFQGEDSGAKGPAASLRTILAQIRSMCFTPSWAGMQPELSV